ncbi:hypothetical protein GOV10_00625, partial [Candidatus Woesearchaeota archaeon]|nr:hypothetical protein [Candidatus Woesearchaeota archaeon]
MLSNFEDPARLENVMELAIEKHCGGKSDKEKDYVRKKTWEAYELFKRLNEADMINEEIEIGERVERAMRILDDVKPIYTSLLTNMRNATEEHDGVYTNTLGQELVITPRQTMTLGAFSYLSFCEVINTLFKTNTLLKKKPGVGALIKEISSEGYPIDLFSDV